MLLWAGSLRIPIAEGLPPSATATATNTATSAHSTTTSATSAGAQSIPSSTTTRHHLGLPQSYGHTWAKAQGHGPHGAAVRHSCGYGCGLRGHVQRLPRRRQQRGRRVCGDQLARWHRQPLPPPDWPYANPCGISQGAEEPDFEPCVCGLHVLHARTEGLASV